MMISRTIGHVCIFSERRPPLMWLETSWTQTHTTTYLLLRAYWYVQLNGLGVKPAMMWCLLLLITTQSGGNVARWTDPQNPSSLLSVGCVMWYLIAIWQDTFIKNKWNKYKYQNIGRNVFPEMEMLNFLFFFTSWKIVFGLTIKVYSCFFSSSNFPFSFDLKFYKTVISEK